ncbi:MAG: tRNA (adenosine(37)-N6)-threonylcarbamoyltransferase complex ATPase subunit type 1 TsaE [Rhodoferax sp.]|nr:tRNA (adenosine(37)-N6)-threonylcarbamoyltransferase complex ATPase subunit type 1 TsaE [Rhodoferax sp.]
MKVRAVDRHTPIVKSLRWPTESATQEFARQLAQHPSLQGAVVTLRGDLGAGKTTLVRHLLRTLGVSGRIKSPTFALVETYELPNFTVWHFDFYRFSDPREWEEAGFRDIFCGPGLKFVEWPEKACGMLPQADLDIDLVTELDESRAVRLTSYSALGVALLVGTPLLQEPP